MIRNKNLEDKFKGTTCEPTDFRSPIGTSV